MTTELERIISVCLDGKTITRADALFIATHADLMEVFAGASKLRSHFRGNRVDLCSIISARTGACSEDCAYCAQSSRSKAEIRITSLASPDEVRTRARAAKQSGARRFCIVTSGRTQRGDSIAAISELIQAVRDEGLLPCATLGLLSEDDLNSLKEAGLIRFHHNLETSRRLFPEICSTHTYEEKLETLRAVKAAGLSLCCGGIFGLGETWEDRVDMALDIREAGADSVPVNFLVPVPGTLMGDRKRLEPLEALRIVALMRFILPSKEIRICGGRLQTLGEFNSMVFAAGADGLLTGDCLTVAGRDPEDDLKLIEVYGLKNI